MTAKPPRPRKARSAQQRIRRNTVRQFEKLATALPGGAPANPITVTSAAVIESQARATPCIQCAGDLELRADRATSMTRGILRELQMICRLCHAPRTLWFQVVVPRPS